MAVSDGLSLRGDGCGFGNSDFGLLSAFGLRASALDWTEPSLESSWLQTACLIPTLHHRPTGAGTTCRLFAAEHRVDVLLLGLLHLPPLLSVALVLLHLLRRPGVGLAVIPAIRHQQVYPAGQLVQFLPRKLHALVALLEHRQQLALARAGEAWRQHLGHRLRANPINHPALAIALENISGIGHGGLG